MTAIYKKMNDFGLEESRVILRELYNMEYIGDAELWIYHRYRRYPKFTVGGKCNVYLSDHGNIIKVSSLSVFLEDVYARARIEEKVAILTEHGFVEFGAKKLEDGFIRTRYVNGFGARADLCWNFAYCKLIHDGMKLTDDDFQKVFARGKQMQDRIDSLEARLEHMTALMQVHLSYMPGGDGAEAAREHFDALSRSALKK